MEKSCDPLAHARNRILTGDALTLLRGLPDACVDLAVFSPPYNLKNSTGNGMKSRGKSGRWKNAKLIDGYADYSDNIPHDEYVAWQRSILTEAMRVLKDDGAVFYNHKRRVQGGLMQDRDDITNGFPIRQIIIWKRSGGINTNPGYFTPTYENIYLIAKPRFQLTKEGRSCGDIWKISQDRKNPHPAPFPLALAQVIIASTNSQVVLDPFMGSGTTAVACKSLGRDYIGFELSEEYATMARERVEEWSEIVPADPRAILRKACDPATPDGEALNGLRAFRRMAEKDGNLDDFLDASFDGRRPGVRPPAEIDLLRDLTESLQDQLTVARNDLVRERKAAERKIAKAAREITVLEAENTALKSPSPPPALTPITSITLSMALAWSVLEHDRSRWVTVADIRANGVAEPTAHRVLAILVNAGWIKRNEVVSPHAYIIVVDEESPEQAMMDVAFEVYGIALALMRSQIKI